MLSLQSLFLFLIFTRLGELKIYDRCELAQDLENIYRLPRDQLSTWICIVENESGYDTGAQGVRGGRGLFQMTERKCGLTLDQLTDEELRDDWKCARKMFGEEQRLSGNGFNAWPSYSSQCYSRDNSDYLSGCFQPITPSKGRPKYWIDGTQFALFLLNLRPSPSPYFFQIPTRTPVRRSNPSPLLFGSPQTTEIPWASFFLEQLPDQKKPPKSTKQNKPYWKGKKEKRKQQSSP